MEAIPGGFGGDILSTARAEDGENGDFEGFEKGRRLGIREEGKRRTVRVPGGLYLLLLVVVVTVL